MGYFALPKIDPNASAEERAEAWVKNAMDNLRLFQAGKNYEYLLDFATYSIEQAKRIENESKTN